MPKAVISLTTGLEDAEKVTVAFLVAVGAAEAGRETLMFLTKEAVRLAVSGFARATACDGCPPLADLMARYEAAGGRYIACGVCVKAKGVDPGRQSVGQRRGGGHGPTVGLDRRRGHHLQLLNGPSAAGRPGGLPAADPPSVASR
jgi:predicted peroxiredoxin